MLMIHPVTLKKLSPIDSTRRDSDTPWKMPRFFAKNFRPSSGCPATAMPSNRNTAPISIKTHIRNQPV